MSTGFKGHGQEKRGPQKGPVSQDDLVPLLRTLVDASKAKSGTRTRDEARAALRALLDTANWNTPYVTRNIGVRRCRHIARLGYRVPYDALTVTGIERLERLNEKGNG